MDVIILIISSFFLIRGKLAIVIFSIILLTTNYFGIGTNVSTFIIRHNVSDSGLILFILLFFYILYFKKGEIALTRINKYVSIFIVFVIISIFIDLVLNGINMNSIFKTSRHWIFLSCFWIFPFISNNTIHKVVSYIFFATIIGSLIILIEYFVNIDLVGREAVKEVSTNGIFYNRGAIPPTFTLFYIFLLFTGYLKYNLKVKYVCLTILIAVVIFSMIRSYFAATLIGIILILTLKENVKIKNVLWGIFVILCLFFITFSNPIIKERFLSGIEDMKNSSLEKEEVNGNYSFRLLQFNERFSYINNKTQYILFGVGNIIEEDFPEVFSIGLRNENDKIIQLDTGDISWSLLILRTGILGTIIYMIIFFIVIIDLYGLRKYSHLMLSLFVYLLLNLTILSFSSSIITTGMFWLLPVLLYSSMKKPIYDKR